MPPKKKKAKKEERIDRNPLAELKVRVAKLEKEVKALKKKK
jgi:hypothetical protein